MKALMKTFRKKKKNYRSRKRWRCLVLIVQSQTVNIIGMFVALFTGLFLSLRAEIHILCLVKLMCLNWVGNIGITYLQSSVLTGCKILHDIFDEPSPSLHGH